MTRNKSTSVLDQLVGVALNKPANERGRVLKKIVSDRNVSLAGRQEFLEAVFKAQGKKTRATRRT